MALLVRPYVKFYALFFCIIAVNGCSLFGGSKGSDLSEPAELQEFTPKFAIEESWRLDVGNGSDEVFPVCIPEIVDGVIYVADRDGDIHAVDQNTGRVNWEVDSKQTITGSIGVGGDLVLVGTSAGQVHAFDRSSGEFKWRSQLASQVLSAPSTNGEQAIAVTQDGKVYGLDASDGSQIWLADINLPLLTIHGNSKPTIIDDIAYLGLDNGKAAAFRMSDGARLWEVRVGIPEGKNDLERMVDIDGQFVIENDIIYVCAHC